MTKKITLTILFLFLFAACAPVPTAPPTIVPIPSPTPTLSPTPEPLPSETATPACEVGAVLLEDVTYPDNTLLTAGEKFTKTWKLQNTGNCPWTGYTVAFAFGDKMNAPDSVPVPETEVKATVNVSVDLVAPLDDGAYTGNFELRDAQGDSIPMGTEPNFWVKIMVGEATDPLGVKQRFGECTYTENPEYVKTMIDIVNKARQDAGRKPLTVNEKLTAAAQSHSVDMACNGKKFLEHEGSDGSYTGQRLVNVGYTNTYYFELLGVGLAQDALFEWSRHENQWPGVIDPYVIEIGVGYAYSKLSRYGGYWTVIVGGPH
jgi:hypothetical protein